MKIIYYYLEYYRYFLLLLIFHLTTLNIRLASFCILIVAT